MAEDEDDSGDSGDSDDSDDSDDDSDDDGLRRNNEGGLGTGRLRRHRCCHRLRPAFLELETWASRPNAASFRSGQRRWWK